MREIKPCPFCGSIELSTDGHFVECDKCGTQGPFNPCAGHAWESWNKRATDCPMVEKKDGE